MAGPTRVSNDRLLDEQQEAYIYTLSQQGDVFWKPNVATPSDLPLTGNDLNDHRIVDSDGFVRKRDGSTWVIPSASGITPAEKNALKGTYPIALNPFRVNNDGIGIEINGEAFSILNGNIWYDIPEFTVGIPPFPNDNVQSGYLRIWALWAIEGINGPEYIFTVGNEYDTGAIIPPLSAGEGPGAGSVLQTRGTVFNFSGTTQPMNAGAENGVVVEYVNMNGEPVTTSTNPVIHFDGTQLITKRSFFVNQGNDSFNYSANEVLNMDFLDGFVIKDQQQYGFLVSVTVDEIFVTTYPVQGVPTIAYIDISNNTGADITIDASDLSNLDVPDLFLLITSFIPGDFLGERPSESDLNNSKIRFLEGNTAIIDGDYYVYDDGVWEMVGGSGGQRNDVYLCDVTNTDSNEFDNFVDAYNSKAPYGYLPYTIRAKPNVPGGEWQIDTGLEHNNQNTTFQSYLSDDNVSGVIYRVSNTNPLTKFSLPKKMNNVSFVMSDDAGTRLWDEYNYPVELDMINSMIENVGIAPLYDFNASATINMRGISSLIGNVELFGIKESGSLVINAYDDAEIGNIVSQNVPNPKNVIINVYSNKVKLHENLKNNENCTINFLGDFYTQRISGLQNDANKTDTIVTASYDNLTGLLTIEPTSGGVGQYSVGDRINITNLDMNNGTISTDYALVVDVQLNEITVRLISGQNRGAYVSGGDIVRNTVLSIANCQVDNISAELSYTTVAGGGATKKVSIIMRDINGNIAILYDGDTINGPRDMFAKAKMGYNNLLIQTYQSQLEVDGASNVSSNTYGIDIKGMEILLVLDCDVDNRITINNLTLTN